MAKEKVIRENWGTRVGFILAAIGSAVGLGNIWRFPGVAYENGGGAFMVPYLVALLTAGIPLLIMEFTIGRKHRGSAPVAFRRLNKNAEVIGWWQVAISIVIAVYYAAIIAWAGWYAFFSIGQQWGSEPEAYLFTDFLQMTPDLYEFGGYQLGLLIAMVVVWAFTLWVIGAGVKKGIETTSKVFIPLLLVMFGVLVVQALTLDGAVDGLNAFFTPDWNALVEEPKVWLNAYGQIFFSLSIGFGIMITYASYLKKKSDITTSALTVGFANSSFEILAGIGVFAALGFMALQSGTPIDEQVSTGVGLAFVAFPTIINTLPYGADLFGVLFFGSLVVAGWTSMVSIVQVPVAAMEDRFGWGRKKATMIFGGGMALVSLALMPAANGLMLLDVSDYFINQYGIVVAALVSIVVVVWVLWKWKELRDNANATSTFKVGPIWFVCLGVITPIMLAIILFLNIRDLLSADAESSLYGYRTYQAFGWSLAGGALAFGVIMALILRRRELPELETEEEAEAEMGATR
ncbi:sodium-dependent transporter [Glycomyces algeriensis]|uniref:Transporter n=1 Tax=Glycomyces algeriensis TaxID=256037 RepID=A0A9W6LFY4_9ACTN|nr:sodium-dependent transporter [Glycomyces algeriensis]MDA1365231.1 sodium-dependent transporter [Glycomyces algeriensis]MDR7349705.1 NSS family neurotransmitter:Na+ symporter [Glycomyces algeriensis]GLI42417.1 transporter [Glycomyces algeriensis]